jgi:hypothetical protein
MRWRPWRRRSRSRSFGSATRHSPAHLALCGPSGSSPGLGRGRLEAPPAPGSGPGRLQVGVALLTAAGLSSIGLEAHPPPGRGAMVAEARNHRAEAPLRRASPSPHRPSTPFRGTGYGMPWILADCGSHRPGCRRALRVRGVPGADTGERSPAGAASARRGCPDSRYLDARAGLQHSRQSARRRRGP